jgi:hypothetical protein
MDDRVEETKLISRISPIRKLELVRPQMDRRELMYQLNRDSKYQKPKRTNFVKKKISKVSKDIDSSTLSNSSEFAVDMKKRSTYDRTIIIDD